LSALDAKLRRGLRGEIHRIPRELGITTVYVTHDPEEALALADRIAVMRDGRIEQIDAPRDVYRRPRSLFVASFLGQANLIPARLAGREGEHTLVDTPLGRFRVLAAGQEREGCGAENAAAQPLTLFFRPESCELRRSSSRIGANILRAVVRRVEYLGSRQLVEVEAAGLGLTVDLPGRDSFAVGGTLAFSVPPERCCLLEQ